MTRQKYQAEISAIMNTAWMLKVLEILKDFVIFCLLYPSIIISS